MKIIFLSSLAITGLVMVGFLAFEQEINLLLKTSTASATTSRAQLRPTSGASDKEERQLGTLPEDEGGTLNHSNVHKQTNYSQPESQEQTATAETISSDHESINDTSTVLTIRRGWRPNQEWVNQCVSNISKDETAIVPFPSLTRDYVLADCVKMCSRCWIGKNRVGETFRIANLYQKRACPLEHPSYAAGGNLTIMAEVLDLYASRIKDLVIPDPGDVVMHLRLGDVIEESEATVHQMLLSGADPAHPGPFSNSIKPIREYLDNFQATGATKVIIVGGGFGGRHYKRSRQYSGCLARAFNYAGYQVEMNVDSSDVDRDFYYMVHAKKFIVTVGGFSQLIGKIVKMLGGEVIGRTFDSLKDVSHFERKYVQKQQKKKNREAQQKASA